jgi:hypothetical protein
MGGHGLDPCGLIKGQVAGSYEHSDDPFVSIKYGKFGDKLRTC